MHFFIFPEKDATLYEASQSMNTGLDEILEIQKSMNSDASVINVSRILMKFNLTAISSSIVQGVIPTTAKYYLNMYDANPTQLATSQSLYIYPISQSWTMGDGKFTDFPTTTEGVSWRYKTGENTADQWSSGSNDTGGNWYSGSGQVASQSFDHETTDFRANVTELVSQWLNLSIPNEGFMIKRSGSLGNENTGSGAAEGNSTKFGNFSFFSSDTHTVYPPKLEIVWDDSSWSTGSLTELSGSMLEDPILYMKGMRPSYKENSKVKFRIVGRKKYPDMTFSTSPSLLTVNYLPSGSTTSLNGTYYSIKDARTEDVIISYGTGSIVSCDSTSNFFTVWMNGFQPERFYEIEFKIVSGSNSAEQTELYYSNNFVFKVAK